MPNVHSYDKRPLTVWIPADVYARFASLAKRNGVPMSEMLVRVMREESATVPLTKAQDLELRRRLKDQTVTVADVAAAVAAEAALTAADLAGFMLRPTLKNAQCPISHTPTPIPKLGSRKKRKLN